jgi:hypothetical protein
MRSAPKVLVGKTESQRPHEIIRRLYYDNIKNTK